MTKPPPIGMEARIRRMLQDIDRLKRRPVPRPPLGHVDLFVGATVPNGWLPMAGGTASSVEYPLLYQRIGTTFGATSTVGGVVQFKLPTMAAPANYVYGIRAID